MAKYVCTAVVSGSKYLGIINADSQEQAEQRAQALADDMGVSLCHQCSEECEDPEITGINASILEE